MNKKKSIIRIVCTVLYFGMILLASRMLISHCASVFGWVGALLKLDADVITYGRDILSQLRGAAIVSPWLVFSVICILCAYGCVRVLGKRKGLLVALGIILFVPLILVAFLLTEVNGILIWKLVRHVLNLL